MICCIFWPAFVCRAQLKAGQNTLDLFRLVFSFQPFSSFLQKRRKKCFFSDSKINIKKLKKWRLPHFKGESTYTCVLEVSCRGIFRRREEWGESKRCFKTSVPQVKRCLQFYNLQNFALAWVFNLGEYPPWNVNCSIWELKKYQD